MKIDRYSRIAVLRLFKDDNQKVVTAKKYIYYSSIVSYEEGNKDLFEWDGPIIYLVCTEEAFYMVGDVDEFEKKMVKYIDAIRKLE